MAPTRDRGRHHTRRRRRIPSTRRRRRARGAVLAPTPRAAAWHSGPRRPGPVEERPARGVVARNFTQRAPDVRRGGPGLRDGEVGQRRRRDHQQAPLRPLEEERRFRREARSGREPVASQNASRIDVSPPKRASSGGGRGAGPVTTRGRRRLHEKQRPPREVVRAAGAAPVALFVGRRGRRLGGGNGARSAAAAPAAAARPTARRSRRKNRPSRSFPTAGTAARALAGPRPPEGTSSRRRGPFLGWGTPQRARRPHAWRRRRRTARSTTRGPAPTGRGPTPAPRRALESRLRERRRDYLCVARVARSAAYAIDNVTQMERTPQTQTASGFRLHVE